MTLDLPARPEGVGVVRQALVGVAAGLARDGAVLSDAKMAVTEACTPAVVHVFAGGKIVTAGGAELADELEAEGYVKYTGAAEPAAAV